MTHIQITPNAPDFRTWLLILIMAIFIFFCLSSCKDTYYINQTISNDENSYTIVKVCNEDSLLKYGFKKSKHILR